MVEGGEEEGEGGSRMDEGWALTSTHRGSDVAHVVGVEHSPRRAQRLIACRRRSALLSPRLRVHVRGDWWR